MLSVSNYHVSALVEEDKLTLLYQLQPGVCDKSFGIDVAKIAHFPAPVIAEARRRISRLEGARGEAVARAEVREGEQLISAALEQLRQLGTSCCRDAELVQRFSEIRQRADIEIWSNRLEPVEGVPISACGNLAYARP